MIPFYTVSVTPDIPEKISRLKEFAYNFWFSWNEPARELFARLDRTLWEQVYHNPVKFLIKVNPDLLRKAAEEEEYLRAYKQVVNDFDKYMSAGGWFGYRYPEYSSRLVAYFSAEFGLHESHPIYSGGLGLLAGDHCKSASDLGVPLVAVGLLYRHGYFTQRINAEGRQEAEYPFQNYHEMPMKPVTKGNGEDLTIAVELPGRAVYVRIWKAQVGKVDLYLLDTDLQANTVGDRLITAQLYGGARENRISQEIILGIGGVRALRAMGIKPDVWHVNEGHAAFLNLERVREKVAAGLKSDVSIEVVRSNTLFTTHTPVPAGHDLFSPELIEEYLGDLRKQLGMTREEFLCLGWDEKARAFNMTVLALNLSDFKNGVSKLHGRVSREMFRSKYGNIPAEEVPISSITNGVHTETWMAPEFKDLMKKYAGEDWNRNLEDPGMWDKVDLIPDEVLWNTHIQIKMKLIRFCRESLRARRIRNFEPRERVAEVSGYLSPDALIIGFARRFATYKRAIMIFRDLDRLASLVNDTERPLQLVFAGKAHPADQPGQELIKRIIDISKQEPFRGKIIFLENYDINVARHLVRGVDVWLNTPRRPQEASGTSGMKAAINGVINCSVLDGWWPEAYNGKNGFAIGEERDYPDNEIQDRDDSSSLYDVLENRIIPLFFDRDGGVPRGWTAYMKNSIKTVGLGFSTDRMVREYVKKFYIPAIERGHYLRKDNFAATEKLESYKDFLRKNWHQVSIYDVRNESPEVKKAGENLSLNTTVRLGNIQHHNVSVEIVYGGVDGDNLHDIKTTPMTMVDQVGDGIYRYRGIITLPQGSIGYTVRVRPASPYLAHAFDLPLVSWAGLN
ncbi:MAG: alpha-glucan family phosphorylase [Bacillota bacterium]